MPPATAARAVNVSLLNDLAGILEDINSTLSALGDTLTAIGGGVLVGLGL
ncbi:MAG: hypothetical protein IE886_04205 [Campylobacterales bacterium]|nr:hypothetical protein [Campylobacterales bacterium]